MAQIITSNSGGGGGGAGAGAYTYKGTVNTYEDLPSTGLKIGDVYNIINEHTTDPKFPAGANVAWTGTEWDVLGGTIDLSSYQKKLVEGNGIDIDGDTNEISVDASIVSGAADGATAIQPNDNVSELVNDAGYIDKDVNNLTNYTKTSDLPDFTTYQLKSNLVTNLTNPDDTHYPSAKAVSDAITSSGGGDMLKSVYDTTNIEADAFDYDNFYNTPTIPTDTGDLTNNAGFITGIDSSDVTTALGYTPYNSTNPDGFITGIDSSDVTSALGYTPANDTDVVKLSGNQTINGTKTFGTSPVVPSKTAAATNTGTAIATEAQVKLVADDVATINGMISSNASSSNKLMDKNYIDDSINSVTAYYITKNAQGDQWATRAELFAATTFYSGGVVRVPTKNDYTIVLADENHDNATTRYIYNSGWEYQYTVNETALTQAQLDALNSGITSGKVSTYDGYATTISGKQDALVSGTNIKTVNGNSLLGSGDVAVAGKEYNAGEGIEIKNGPDYSAMQGPAPSGFHVPLNTEWQAVYDVWTALGGGIDDGTNFGIALKLPFAGLRIFETADVLNQGFNGNYWSSTRNNEDDAYYLYFDSSNIYPQDSNYRSNAFSVRCFKDTPIIPTLSWTKLYGTSIESGGIFWSSTDGLISLSSDGQTWITIADKNLGATTVWNSGDTLSEANCGKYYQWGNNYGFDWTGSVTTSLTQVDASAYGPGNYYSSSTFIEGRSDWSSVQNDNLWGGVTGIVENVITNTGVLSVNGQTGNVTIPTGLQVAPNSPITGIKYIWYGTEADYANLSQYYTDNPGDTEYHTF